MTNDKTLTIRLPRQLVAALHKYRLQVAARTGIEVSKSQAIRLLLQRALEQEGGTDATANL